MGKGFKFEETFVTTVTNDLGEEVSVRETNSQYQGSLVSNVWLVGRLDYRIWKQLRVGLVMHYGLTTSFNDYNYETRQRYYEMGTLLQEDIRREERNSSFKYGFTRFSLPSITLGYSFGKQ